MSADDDGRSDEGRERRGKDGGRGTPPRRGGNPQGGRGGAGSRKPGGPRSGGPQGARGGSGGESRGKGRPGDRSSSSGRSGSGAPWKGGQGKPGERDERRPNRPFKRSDDRRPQSGEGRSQERYGAPRGSGGSGERPFKGQGQGRPQDRKFQGRPQDRDDRPNRGERRPGASREQGSSGGGRFEGNRGPGGPRQGSGERRFEGSRGPGGPRQGSGGRRFDDNRGEGRGRPGGPRPERESGGERRFEGNRGRPGGSRPERDSGGAGRRFEGNRSENRSRPERAPGSGGRYEGNRGRPGGSRPERDSTGGRRFEGNRGGEGRRFEGNRSGGGRPSGSRPERDSGGRRFEGNRGGGRPEGQRSQGSGGRRFDGGRDKNYSGRRPQEGGRSYGPPRERGRYPSDERERPAPKHDDPILPDDVTGEELDADARAELRTLPKDLATRVARHLVMAGRLSDEDAEASYKHARAARRLASRVGIVREAAGLAAYYAGEWSEALAELRAARRLSASEDAYLPIMADCERGLGRPERALDLVKSPEAKKLDQEGKIELRLVESGARRDLGQFDAAVVTLQIPELRDRRLRPWSARLFYAYADALADAGREPEAVDWFARAAAADRDGETDAAERYAELEGLEIFDTEEDEESLSDGAAHTDPTDSLPASTQPEPSPQAEPAAALAPEPEPDPKPAIEPEPELEFEAEPEAELEAEAEAELGPEGELEFEAEGEDEPKAEAAATDAEAVTKPELEPDEVAAPPGIVPATDIAFKPAPMPETEDDIPGDEGVAEAPAIFLEPTDEDD